MVTTPTQFPHHISANRFQDAKAPSWLPTCSPPSAWQHSALTESRYQAEHQQSAEMHSRSVLQRLRAIFVSD